MPEIDEQRADELRRLADLHRDGVLDDGEFAAAKQRLLGLEHATTVVRGQGKSRAERAWSEARAAVWAQAAALAVWVPALLLGAEPTDPVATVPSLLSFVAGIAALLALVRGIRERRDTDVPLARRAARWGGGVLAFQIVATVIVLIFAWPSEAGEPVEQRAAEAMLTAKKAHMEIERCAALSATGSHEGCEAAAPAGTNVAMNGEAFTIEVSGDGDLPTYRLDVEGSNTDESCEPSDDTLCPRGRWPDLGDLETE